jgi:hypothetical protein
MKTTIFEGYGLSYGYGYGNGNGLGNGLGNGSGFGGGVGNGLGNGSGFGEGLGYGSVGNWTEDSGCGQSYDGNSRGGGRVYYNDIYVTLLSPITAWHVITGKIKHGRKDIDTEHAYNAGEKIELCRFGLHASLDLKDAQKYTKYYATGIETRVQCSGRVMFGSDKLVCEHREVVEVL